MLRLSTGVLIATCAVGALGVTSCAGSDEPESDDPTAQRTEAVTGSRDAQPDNPVIAASEQAQGYPEALVRGVLRMVEGCLLIDDYVVHWPYGTSWDPESNAVVFAEDFDAKADAVVGEHFRGGGGFTGPPNGQNQDVVRDCIERTGASGAVFAYPA